MKALVSGRRPRSSTTGVSVSRSQASSAMPRYLSSRLPRPPRAACTREPAVTPARGRRSGLLHAPGRHDHPVLERCVLISPAPAGGNARDFVDDIQAGRDAAENGVAIVARTGIEEGVVGQIDEALRRL